MEIPHMRKPFPGESYAGYIMSLATMNDMSLDRFEHHYLYGYERPRRSSAGYPESLSHVCRRMRNEPFFPDIEQAVRMTPYDVEAEGLTERRQAKLAETLLYDIREEETPCLRSHTTNGLRYCKECQKEDLREYGSWYFHLVHNLPGVCVCAKHKRPLLEMPRMDKRKENIPDMDHAHEMKVLDMEDAILQAQKTEVLINRQEASGTLQEQKCPICGESYLAHPYSIRSGAGCPFCRYTEDIRTLLQHRLDLVYPKEYHLYDASKGLKTKAMHLPCGETRRSVEQLLYEESKECADCKNWPVKKTQNQIDPEKKHFVILRSFRSENDSSRLRIRHVDCGRTFEVSKTYFIADPLCTLCEREARVLPYADLGVPGYSMASAYYNNRDRMKIRHEECGCVFETSKTALLAGNRCPVCTNRYSFEMVKEALAECTDGYRAVKSKKRGKVDVYLKGTCICSGMPYYKVMLDLQADESELFPDRRKKYIPPKSIRRTIYDAVKEGVKEKGFWVAADDGIDGKMMTRGQRNILQDLTNQGYIKRIKKGVYTIEQDTDHDNA